MSTIRATYVQHGSSAVPNITLNASGQVIVASGIVSSGTFAAPSGSAAAPGVYFVGDTDTGLYSPGANQVAISTSGTERARIDSSGRLLVGTSISNISGASAIIQGNPNNTAGPGILYISRGETTPVDGIALGQLRFSDSGHLTAAAITVYRDGGTWTSGSSQPTNLIFSTTPDGSASPINRMEIDSSGRLLLGTSTARTNYFGISIAPIFQIEDTNHSFASITRNANDEYFPSLILAKSRSTGNTVVQNNDEIGRVAFQGNDGSTFVESAWIRTAVEGTPATGNIPGLLAFATAPAGGATPIERLRISANGNVSIGLGTNLTRLYVRAAGNTDTTFNAYITNTDNNYLFVIRDDGLFYTGAAASSPYNYTTVTAANVVVDPSGILYRSTSSARYKTNIETLEDTYADNILNCRPVWYRSTANADDPSWGWWGFIAEEVAEIDPRLVFWKTKETKLRDDYVQEEGKAPGPADYVEVELDTPIAEGVQYDRFVPHLVNLIKRQQQAIEDLQLEVAALKNQ